MQIKEMLISIPILLFILWVFAAPLPKERIARSCSPIAWVGNMATSTTALANEKHTETSAGWSAKLTYGCEYLIWRLLYQDDFNKAVEEGRVVTDGEGNVVVHESDGVKQSDPIEPPSKDF